MKEDNKGFFSEFPPVSKAEWEAKIREDLKGADYEKKLVTQPVENFITQPYYTGEDIEELPFIHQLPGEYPFIRGNKTGSNRWEIRQDFRVFDTDTAVKKSRMALERGADSAGFDISFKEDLNPNDIKILIDGFDFTNKHFHLTAGAKSKNAMDFLMSALDEVRIHPSAVKGSLNYDPLGHLTATGNFYETEEEDMGYAAKLMSDACSLMPGFRIIAVNSNIFSNSGASTVQELGFGLAMLADYLTQLTDAGWSVNDIVRHTRWNMGVGSDYFMEIAKLRAARVLFASMLSAFDPEVAKRKSIFIHSITTRWNKTSYDPHVNMLRLTTEAMAAVLGGCDSLLVEPYDTCFRLPGDFSERLARNIQIILRDESYFDRVTDPAAGSYYIEKLTDTLVEQAWDLFLKTDNNGGYAEAFKKGLVTDEINNMVLKRRKLVSTRREVLVGTNQYPDSSEEVAGNINTDIAFGGQTINGELIAKPVKEIRAAVEFEKLRLAVENRKGKRPLAFMLTIGNLAKRLARSQFACNFFACGGYAVKDNLGFESPEQGVEEAMKVAADIVVICSSDEEYSSLAPVIHQLVKGRALVVVAGAPASMDELKQHGITEFIHMKSNVLESLQNFHQQLGIA